MKAKLLCGLLLVGNSALVQVAKMPRHADIVI
jgi:hypothetical protein